MYIVRHKETGNYLAKGRRFNKLVAKDKARVFQSELGAKRSITYGLLDANKHLLDAYEIIQVTIK